LFHIDERSGYDEYSKMDAQIRYYFHIDPDLLDEDQYARIWNQCTWFVRTQSKLNDL